VGDLGASASAMESGFGASSGSTAYTRQTQASQTGSSG